MSFISIIVAGSLLGPMTCLAIGSLPDSAARYGIHLVECALDLIRKWLVPPVLIASLLHQWLCRAEAVITVAHRAHRAG